MTVAEFGEHLKVHKFPGKTKVSEFQHALAQISIGAGRLLDGCWTAAGFAQLCDP